MLHEMQWKVADSSLHMFHVSFLINAFIPATRPSHCCTVDYLDTWPFTRKDSIIFVIVGTKSTHINSKPPPPTTTSIFANTTSNTLYIRDPIELYRRVTTLELELTSTLTITYPSNLHQQTHLASFNPFLIYLFSRIEASIQQTNAINFSVVRYPTASYDSESSQPQRHTPQSNTYSFFIIKHHLKEWVIGTEICASRKHPESSKGEKEQWSSNANTCNQKYSSGLKRNIAMSHSKKSLNFLYEAATPVKW